MVACGQPDLYDRWKPDGYKHYLTIAQLARQCDRDVSRLKQLERNGIIAAPIRVKVGRHSVRLYHPDEVAAIVIYFSTINPRRPKKRQGGTR